MPNEASLSPLGSALPMFGSVRIEPVLGYNSFDVRRYKEFLQMAAGESEPLQPRQGLFGFPISDVFPIVHKSLLDLLGTKYLVQPHQSQSAGFRSGGARNRCILATRRGL